MQTTAFSDPKPRSIDRCGLALRLLLVVGCLLGGLSASRLDAEEPSPRLGSAVAPTFQSVRLRLDPAAESYIGWARVSLDVREPVSEFAFYAEGQRLRWLELRDDVGTIGFRYEQGADGRTVVRPERELAAGRYTFSMEFTQSYNTRAVGLYRMTQGESAYLFTQFQATDARKAFPCWDEPSFKIPYQLVVDAPLGLEVVSNTPIEAESVLGDWRTVVFRRTPPMPSYLLALAVGRFESVEIPGMSIPGRVVTLPGQSGLAAAASRMTPPILAALESYFEDAYPYAKLDLVAVPEFWPGAMENPGAVFYKDSLLLVDESSASPAELADLARVTAHELAHMWFGDKVTMSWWDDLWLNESFADWLGDKISNEVFPRYEISLTELSGVQRIMSVDARPSTDPIRRPRASANDMMQDVGLAYEKGKAVLGMVESWLGPAAFREGIREYMVAHAWGTTEAADFWRVFGTTRGTDRGDADIESSMRGFLDQSGLPLVRLEPDDEGRLRLRQSRFLNWGVRAADTLWTFPLGVRYSRRGEVEERTFVLAGSSAATDLPWSELEWIVPNAASTGYLRWSLPTAQLVDLASRAGEVMTPRERMGFIGNTQALLQAGEIGGDTYLEVLGYFARDSDPQVVSAVVAAIRQVEMAFVPQQLETAFAEFVRETFSPALEHVGDARDRAERPSVSQLRAELLQLLGGRGDDTEAREVAAGVAEDYLAGAGGVDGSLVAVALQLTAIEGDRSLFDEYRRRFETATVPAERSRYLTALGSFSDPALRRGSLDYVLTDSVRPNEIFTVAQAMVSDREGREAFFTWLTENYDAVLDRVPPMFASFMPMVASGCSADRLGAAETFFRDESRHTPGIERTLRRVADQVQDCVSLRRREGAVVSEYLRSLDRW